MSTAMRRALYGKLAGDTTLTSLLAAPVSGYSKSIYYRQAPENATFPFVVFFKQSGMPRESFHTPSIMDTETWQVRAVDHNTSQDPAEAIRDRFVTLLNDAVLSISGRTLLKLRRETDVEYPEVVDGELYVHVGVLFRVDSA
jgi:hypothetical protein